MRLLVIPYFHPVYPKSVKKKQIQNSYDTKDHRSYVRDLGSCEPNFEDLFNLFVFFFSLFFFVFLFFFFLIFTPQFKHNYDFLHHNLHIFSIYEYITRNVTSSQLAWQLGWQNTALVSHRSWVRIPFRPEFFSGFTFATVQVAYITAVQMYVV